MKSVLFLTDYWLTHQTPNSVCAENICSILKERGFRIYVCSYGEKEYTSRHNGMFFKTVKPALARQLISYAQWNPNNIFSPLIRQIGNTINRVRRLSLFPIYPTVSLSFSRRWAQAASELIKEKGIQKVVSVMAPDESLYTGYLLKNLHPEISWTAYYVDSGTNLMTGTPFRFIKSLLQGCAKRTENKFLEAADRIIVMKGHSSYYRSILSNSNKKKLETADVPLFYNMASDTVKAPASNNIIKWVYTGCMEGIYYDPRIICDFFLKYKQIQPKAELHLYGHSDKTGYLNNITNPESHSGIFWHGSVPHCKISEILSNGDILLYYKTKNISSVSGKFFEYLKYGHPIVYIGPKGDINSEAAAKYPLSRIIDISLPSYKAAVLMKEAESLMFVPPPSAESLNQLYKLNCPEYTANLL